MRRAFAIHQTIAAFFAFANVTLFSPDGWTDEASDYEKAIPAALRGPFVSRPDVVTQLDCPDNACQGPLNFTRSIEARVPPGSPRTMTNDNPFSHDVAKGIAAIIADDIDKRSSAWAVSGDRLNEKFLTDVNSRVQLVGIVNRMDRQFIKDPIRQGAQANCGEISVIYRFFYSIREGRQYSRLPVTMNLVFPALPGGARRGSLTCAKVAQRWLDELERPVTRTAAEVVADLTNPLSGPLALIDGRDLERIELNAQAYRAKASNKNAAADFGTRAEYIIRVFEWSATENPPKFVPRFLNNQIDRDQLLCSAQDKKTGECESKNALRDQLVAYLSKPEVVASIDLGELDIPASYKRVDKDGKTRPLLASRGISVSPGGAHRSRNRPFWDAGEAVPALRGQQIIRDDEIARALANARSAGQRLRFIGNENDFRTRLDQMTCTGCHQTRAIAGFHFPGADRDGTPDFNSVYLAGSPHFYGDQPRRIEILKAIARSGNAPMSQVRLAASYADRPDQRFAEQLSGTEILGGWGASCTVAPAATAKRNWTCNPGLLCSPVFTDTNGVDPALLGDRHGDRMGSCMPPKPGMQIGDALQSGYVTSRDFDQDTYHRRKPCAAAPEDELIAPCALPQRAPPTGNEFYGAHQEFYTGEEPTCRENDPEFRECLRTRRDAQTGGFPGGMLRLSECLALPDEATCGFVAASGFNRCIEKMPDKPQLNTKVCFRYFTAYAGMRACDAASPCRDDYICVHPMTGYDTEHDAEGSFNARQYDLEHPPETYSVIVGAPPYTRRNFGEQQPDPTWVRKKDRRGYCIPPYFVFQFRSDGHPPP